MQKAMEIRLSRDYAGNCKAPQPIPTACKMILGEIKEKRMESQKNEMNNQDLATKDRGSNLVSSCTGMGSMLSN